MLASSSRHFYLAGKPGLDCNNQVMKKLPLLVFLFSFCSSPGQAQTPATTPNPPAANPAPAVSSPVPTLPTRNPAVPAIIAAGFDTYAKSGSKAALDVWFKGSPLDGDVTAKGNLNIAMGKTEAVFGKMLGWDFLKTVSLTPSTTVVYTNLKLEKGPLWIAFYCYRPTPASEWTVYSMGLDSNPIKVLPPGILAGQ